MCKDCLYLEIRFPSTMIPKLTIKKTPEKSHVINSLSKPKMLESDAGERKIRIAAMGR